MVLEALRRIEGVLTEVAALQKEYVDRVCGTYEVLTAKGSLPLQRT